MKYILISHVPQAALTGPKDPAAVAAGRAYGEALNAAGVFVAGVGLGSPHNATILAIRDGKRQVQDGPYADTKEFLGGFVILDVPDLDTALEWAARNPAAELGTIEVLPVGGCSFAPPDRTGLPR